MLSRGKWVINYKRLITATIIILSLLYVRSIILDKQSIAYSDYWGEIKLDLSYPPSKDELILRIENYRPKNIDIPILVKQVWLNYTKIPVPDDLWIEPGETKLLLISPNAEYIPCKCVVVKVWYSLELSEKINYYDNKVVTHLSQ
ncbi:MAG: hypothetical protein ACFFB5_24820 [Promethearchaeota archaeon]